MTSFSGPGGDLTAWSILSPTPATNTGSCGVLTKSLFYLHPDSHVPCLASPCSSRG